MAISETSAQPPLTAPALARLSASYAEARILHTAVEVGLFELLAEGPLDRDGIAARLRLHPRLLRDFLGAVTALGLTEREGERFRIAPDAAEFLVPGGPLYLGGRIRTAARRHYHTWGRLTEALRDGEPKAGAGGDAFAALYTDPEATRSFLVHMDANNGVVGPQLAEAVDWSAYASFTDVGGARGNVAAQLVRRRPHLDGAVFELPAVEPFFDEHMSELGVADRVTFHAGDFFADALPGTEVLILGHVLHDWSPEERQKLLDRVYAALPPGGAVVVYDQMLDEDAPELRSLIGSLNVALITPGGSEYTVPECRAWLAGAGFVFLSATRLAQGNDTVVVAAKPT
ncbi:methyltransferase [Streptomyces boncukensis]|uniref:Methyltransferase n=1 Tax=Streptomyces boncukensis TaxID=2711219 RepID=A0A6G4X447_9ACTN|nr:methyltransferase [Streptomyces boncukensis]NGO71627.1 methyltransferase [Streptomyces boncukensis]